jgi:hypothetical protein
MASDGAHSSANVDIHVSARPLTGMTHQVMNPARCGIRQHRPPRRLEDMAQNMNVVEALSHLRCIGLVGAPAFERWRPHAGRGRSQTIGNHSLKAGVSFQAIRVFERYAAAPLGQYFFGNVYTGAPGVSFTGYGVADFLANQMSSADIYTTPSFRDSQWYDSAYFQDDWKITRTLTFNVGLRYDHYEPYKERNGNQANITQASNLGIAPDPRSMSFPRGLESRIWARLSLQLSPRTT